MGRLFERREKSLNRALIAELVKALEPFASAITRAETLEPTDPVAMLGAARDHVTLYEFAHARSLLSRAKEAGHG